MTIRPDVVDAAQREARKHGWNIPGWVMALILRAASDQAEIRATSLEPANDDTP